MEQDSSKGTAHTVVLTVAGMTCTGCASSVGRVLSRVPGVTDAQVDLASGRATVTGTARVEDLLEAVEGAGYGGRLS